MKEDPDFDFASVLSDLINEGYVEQIQDRFLNITTWGNIVFNDLKEEKIEELNKKAYILRGIAIILFFITVMAFVKYFPRIIDWWTHYNSSY